MASQNFVVKLSDGSVILENHVDKETYERINSDVEFTADYFNRHVHQPIDNSSDGDSGAIESMTSLNNRRWDNEVTLFFLDCMHAHKDTLYLAFKRREIMRKVAVQMAEKKYNLSMENLLKKWNNLIRTYRTIKDKIIKGTGGEPHNWPYYDVMCELVQRSEALPNITQYASSSLVEKKQLKSPTPNMQISESISNVSPNAATSKSSCLEYPLTVQRGPLQARPPNRPNISSKKSAKRRFILDEQEFKENDSSKRTKLLESIVEFAQTKQDVKSEAVLAEIKDMNNNLKAINSQLSLMNTNINNLCQIVKAVVEK